MSIDPVRENYYYIDKRRRRSTINRIPFRIYTTYLYNMRTCTYDLIVIATRSNHIYVYYCYSLPVLCPHLHCRGPAASGTERIIRGVATGPLFTHIGEINRKPFGCGLWISINLSNAFRLCK